MALASHLVSLGLTVPKIVNNKGSRKILPALHPNEGVTAWYTNVLKDALLDAVNDAVMMLTPLFQAKLPVGIRALDQYVQVRVKQDRREVTQHTYDDEGNPYSYVYSIPVGPRVETYRIAMDAPPTVTKIDRELKKWGDKWQRKFDKLSRDASKKFATRSLGSTDVAMKAALKKAGFTVSFKPTRKSMQAYKLVVADNVGLIRNLQQSLYSKIQQDVWASVRAGGDMATLSQKLHKSYGIEVNRAALIARDQNNKAKATLEAARRQELGLTQAIWQHSGGGKEPRPVHLAWGREGKVFDLNKGLFDPDEGQWVLPGTLINCRCTSRAIIPGFDDYE